MTPITLTPKDEADWLDMRRQDVTSTESAALFGMSPYVTHFELWFRKRLNTAAEFKPNERMQWGNRLETAIAHGIAEDQGWRIEPMKEYMRLGDLKAGASFDFRITNLGDPVHLEIKNVDYMAFRDGWIEHDDGTIEAPEHIEMQVQHQMMVSGYKRAFIGAFIAGNRGVVIERERDEDVIEAMRKKISAFWVSIFENNEPSPIMPDDAAAVIRLNQYAQPGKILDASGDAEITSLVLSYQQASAAEKLAKEDKEVAKAQLLERIGDAENVMLEGYRISAGTLTPTIVPEFTRAGYRNMRIYARKPK